MTKPLPLLVRPEQIDTLADELSGCDLIAFDTEFIRETTFFPKIALIQVATDDKVWLVDPTALTRDDLAPLLDIFEDPKIVKVVHAAYADQECFFWTYDMVASPVMDTAVAGALCGIGENVGLAKLAREILGVNIPKGRARVKWLQRPLPDELLFYAEEDVVHLVRLGRTLLEKLEKNGRTQWMYDESVIEPAVFDQTPEELALRMGKDPGDGRHYSVLVELVRWREERARRADMPRAWVADNEVLLALSKVQPKSIQELKSFRGLNAKEVERNGAAILDAVSHGMANPIPVPHRPRSPMLSENEEHIVDFIQTYVSYLSSRHEVATKYLMNAQRAARILRHREWSVEDWVKEGILTSHAAQLIGQDLAEAMRGHRALCLKDGKVQIVPIGG